MKTRLAINGFGRIGRNAFRVAFDRDDVEIVAINDLTDSHMLAHLLKYDSNYGQYHHQVGATDNAITVNNHQVPVSAEREPANLPWGDHQVDVVIESTGLFTNHQAASKHLQAGAKRVVISAPAKDEQTPTIVLGANQDDFDEDQPIVSNASCTTNSLAAVMKIMEEHFGVEKAMMTTVHSYTADQRLQDAPHKDFRRARAAAKNIVPTTTGAAVAVTKTLPSLSGKFDGLSMRVPTSVVSISDITMLLARDTHVDEIKDRLRQATEQDSYQGILTCTDNQLVSSDFIGNPHSGIIDLPLTNLVAGNLAKVVVWYDNEWGYSNRLVELAAKLGSSLKEH